MSGALRVGGQGSHPNTGADQSASAADVRRQDAGGGAVNESCRLIRPGTKKQRNSFASSLLLPAARFSVPVRVRALYYVESGVLQRFKAAQDRRRVIDTFCFEISHRTGAGMFGRSSAVGDNRLVTR